MANMCVTPVGFAAAEAIRFGQVAASAILKQGVAIAEFVLNAKDAVANFKKLNEINKQALDIEEAQLAALESTYWGAEDAILAESQIETPWEDEATLARRYAGRLWSPFAGQIAKEMRMLECTKGRYCTQAYKMKVQELATQAALARINVTVMAEKIAWYEVQAVKERDFNRRLQGVAGRAGSAASNSSAMLAHAAALVNTAQKGFANAAQSAIGGMNSALTAFGAGWAEMKNARNGVGADPGFHQDAQKRGSSGVVSWLPAAPQGSTEDGYRAWALLNGGTQNTQTGEWMPPGAGGVSSSDILDGPQRFNPANMDLINTGNDGYIAGGNPTQGSDVFVTNPGGGATD